VSNKTFDEALQLAGEAGVRFSGVLCGRATWKDGVEVYAKNGLDALEAWLKGEGVENIRRVNKRLSAAASLACILWRRKRSRRRRAEEIAAASMFLCISTNPAIDKRLRVSELRLGAVNRVLDAIPEPGGKAAHVALALRALGARPAWVGFTGGANGENLIAGLAELGIRARAIPTKLPTRVNWRPG